MRGAAARATIPYSTVVKLGMPSAMLPALLLLPELRHVDLSNLQLAGPLRLRSRRAAGAAAASASTPTDKEEEEEPSSLLLSLSLRNNALSGGLPQDFGRVFWRLTHLDLSGNTLTGDILTLKDAPGLTALDLSNCAFSGA